MSDQQPTHAENDFSGRGDAVVQAGAVHGGIHLHRDARPRPVPLRQLPMSPPRFVNREQQLRSLDALLAARSGRLAQTAVVTAVAGAPGVGKTSLALHWAHRVRHHFPDGDLYLNLRGYGPGPTITPAQALGFFLRALGVSPEHIPLDVELSTSLYRSLLDGRRVLIVIDNAASAAQVRPLLPASPTCMTIVTSRSRLSGLVVAEGAEPVVVDVLTPAESLEMLRRVIGAERIRAEAAAADRLVRRCGRLPLALRIVAERLADQPYLPLAELADELDDEYRRLDALRSEEDELSDVRAVFSWSYHRLPAEAARLFRLLGLHAGADLGLPAAAALNGEPVPRTRRALGLLTGAHLLQQPTADRYRLHDLLRVYAAERAEADESPDQRRRAVRRVLRWYFLTAANARRAFLPDLDLGTSEVQQREDPVEPLAFTGADDAMAWFEVERFTLLDALEQAGALGHDDLAARFPKAVAGFFEVRAYWSDYANAYRIGLRAAEAIGSARWEVVNLVGLGDANRILNRLDEARDYYQRAARVSARIGDRRSEGFALRGLGLLHEKSGRYEQAAEHYGRALAALRAAGSRRGEGMCLLSLGDCHRALGGFTEAVDHGFRALEVFRETGDLLTQGLALDALGLSHLAGGHPDEAIRKHLEALEVFRKFATPHRQALTLLHLGDALGTTGHVDQARRHWSEALEIFDRIGAPEAGPTRERLT